MNKSIFSNSVFSRVFLSQFLSGVGDKVVLFLLPLWVLQTTNSPFLVSIISASTTAIIILLSPFMGTFADRMSKRRIMITADGIRILLMILLALLTLFTPFNFGYVLLIFVIYTAGSSLYSPASDVSLTIIVEESHLKDAVSLRQTSNQLENLLGPIIGGILFGVISPGYIFLGDAICFVFSFVILLFTSFPNDSSTRKKVSYWSDFKEGVDILYKENRLRVLIFSAALINIFGAAIMLSLQVHVIKMEVNSFWWSVIFTSSPVGIIIGSLISRKLKLNNRTYTDAYVFCSLMGFFNILMGLTSAPVPLIVTYFLSGIAFGMSNVYFGVLYRKIIPKNKQGRFFGFLNATLLMAIPIGQLITGFILENTSPSFLLIVFGILTVLTSLVSLYFLKNEAQQLSM